MPKINKKLLTSMLFALLLLTPIAFAAQLNLKYKGTAFPQVSLNDKIYTGFSREDAKKVLENEISEKYKDGLKLVYKDQTYVMTLTELGYEIDTDSSLEQIFSYGHNQDILQSAKEQLSLINNNPNFQNKITAKDFLIESARWEEIAKNESPAQNFSYAWSGTNFIEISAKEGLIFDQNQLRQDVENNLKNLQNETIELKLIRDIPVIEQETDQKALEEAKKLIEKNITLKYNSNLWKVTKEDFGNWIDFTATEDKNTNYTLELSPDKEQVKQYLVSLVPQINHEPVNAQLEFKNGKAEVFSLSQDGIQVNVEDSAKKIITEIFQTRDYTENQTESETPAADNGFSVEIIIDKVKPEFTTDDIDNMGITSLLITGESNFHGSTNSRRHNIAVGASKFNGILVGPNDEFSFNEILGNVGPKEGYLPELVIKQGQTVPEYGGGLCQVSTTAFRGAVYAGLEVTKRSNHAYAVKYYDPQGTDATIYPPDPDLAFINNTPNYILIQTRISGDNLYFDFYGTDDGRKVETEGPVVYERGTGGAMKTWWKQRVYDKEGNMFLEKTFYSNYKSATLYPRANPLD
ncbi:MAG: VanW family protein [Candidatus Paceibacterota bacterium]